MLNENVALDSLADFEQFEAYTLEGKKVRCKKQPDNQYFVLAKGKRNWGYFYPKSTFLQLYTPIIKTEEDKTAKWHKDINRALKEIEKSGFWKGSNIETMLRNLLKINLSEKAEIEKLYWNAPYVNGLRQFDESPMRPYMEKFPFMFITEKMEPTAQPDFTYFSDLAMCKLKSMYFGKGSYEKTFIKVAMFERRDYSCRAYTSYDVSFHLEFPKDKKDFTRAWYSEEYRGCGNGHYYLALSENCALFCEDD